VLLWLLLFPKREIVLAKYTSVEIVSKGMLFCFLIRCLSRGVKPPHIPNVSCLIPHSAHSILWSHPAHMARTFGPRLSPFSKKKSSGSTSAHRGASYRAGSRIRHAQIVWHLSLAPFGAAHIHPLQGPFAEVPERKVIVPCLQLGDCPSTTVVSAGADSPTGDVGFGVKLRR
jgi:hypothetical protein